MAQQNRSICRCSVSNWQIGRITNRTAVHFSGRNRLFAKQGMINEHASLNFDLRDNIIRILFLSKMNFVMLCCVAKKFNLIYLATRSASHVRIDQISLYNTGVRGRQKSASHF